MTLSHPALRPLLYLFMLLSAAVSLSACNTMEGLGEDTQSLGAEIDEEAEEAQ